MDDPATLVKSSTIAIFSGSVRHFAYAPSQTMAARRSKKSTYSQPHIAVVMVMKKVRPIAKSGNVCRFAGAAGKLSAGSIGKCSTPKGWAMLLSYVGGGAQRRLSATDACVTSLDG